MNKLVDVEKVVELDSEHSSLRELVLVKLNWKTDEKAKIKEIAETFGARTIKEDEESVTYEYTGGPEKVNAFLHILRPYDMEAANRSGAVAIVE